MLMKLVFSFSRSNKSVPLSISGVKTGELLYMRKLASNENTGNQKDTIVLEFFPEVREFPAHRDLTLCLPRLIISVLSL